MGKKQFHTRLDDDTAEWVDEFREERDITQAEAVRRLVRAGQQEYQRDDSDEDKEAETDGGKKTDSVPRQFFQQSLTLYAVITIVTGVPTLLRPFGVSVPFSPYSVG